VATPVGTYVGQILEPVRNAVIDFFFVTILESIVRFVEMVQEGRTPVFDLDMHLVTTFS
jgi:hypothetical protein